jgi:sugar fermentation stimulation protein A
MIYEKVRRGSFLRRPNRFIAEVALANETVVCHVKNTGRCKELLLPGAPVYLSESANPKRATKYDLVAVEKGGLLINMDSLAPNQAFREYLEKGAYIAGLTVLKPETRFLNSRFDFYLEAGERKIYLEVKGVTLEENGVVMFPDAPTLRGVKHLEELTACLDHGYEGHVVFVAQMSPATYFTPNHKTHPAFGSTLAAAVKAGVQATAFDCVVRENSLAIKNEIEVRLAPPRK